MMIRLLEAVRLRSEELPAGAEIEVSDFDSRQLMAAGQAEPVAAKQPTKSA